jgi:hypothetical protein
LVLAPCAYVTSLSYGTLVHTYIPPLVPVTSQQANATLVSSTTSQSLVCSTVSTTWRSLVCNYGNFTYTVHKSIPSLGVLFSAAFLDYITLWIAIPLSILISYYIFISRRSPIVQIISTAFLLVAVTALFDNSIHSMYRYYFIPVYALLLVACYTRRSLTIVSFVLVLSLFLPSGSFQLLPPLFCMLILLIYLYRKVPGDRKLVSDHIGASKSLT